MNGLSRPFTEIGNDAPLAQRTPRQADIAPVQNKPVMGMTFVFGRNHLFEPALHLKRRFPDRESGAIADPEDVRVYCDRGLAERDVENHIRGLATDPRQCLECLTAAWDLASMLFNQLSR